MNPSTSLHEMKPSPWKCGTCRKKTVSPVSIPTYVTEMEYDGRKYRIELPNFDVLKCDRCGTIVLTDAAEEMLVEAFVFARGNGVQPPPRATALLLLQPSPFG